MEKKKTVKKAGKTAKNAAATKKTYGQDGRATAGRPSAVVDTRVVFCGDKLRK